MSATQQLRPVLLIMFDTLAQVQQLLCSVHIVIKTM